MHAVYVYEASPSLFVGRAPPIPRATSSEKLGLFVFPDSWRKASSALRTASPSAANLSGQAAMANLATEVKLYGRWSFEDVEVKDISLEDYIACKPKYAQFLPHSQGRWQKKRFRKAQCPIVERLVCSIMRKGRNNGKKVMAVRIVKHAFEIIHLLTDQNPVQVFVEAVVNCGPREDSTRVGGGGAVRRQACDVSPLRRVNSAIYLIAMGSRESAFRNIKTIAECLADEIMNAAKVRPRPPPPLTPRTQFCAARRNSAGAAPLRASARRLCAPPSVCPHAPSLIRLFPPLLSGFVEQLRYQEEGRARARREVQPLSARSRRLVCFVIEVVRHSAGGLPSPPARAQCACALVAQY